MMTRYIFFNLIVIRKVVGFPPNFHLGWDRWLPPCHLDLEWSSELPLMNGWKEDPYKYIVYSYTYNLYTCMCTCTCHIHMYIHMHVYVFSYTHDRYRYMLFTHIYHRHIHTYMCIHTHAYAYADTCIHRPVLVCAYYIYMCVHIAHKHTHVYILGMYMCAHYPCAYMYTHAYIAYT